MDLSKLGQSERVAAKVYLRNRRRAYDHFYFMQDLKPGDFIVSKKTNKVYRVYAASESYDASPLDIVICCEDIKQDIEIFFAFSIRAFENGMLDPFLKYYNKASMNKTMHNSFTQQFEISETAKVLYNEK